MSGKQAKKKNQLTRLVFHEADIDRVDQILVEFLRQSQARCAMLIDREGYMITRQGSTKSFDNDTISALVAGSFAATKEMARLLGQDEFSVLYHQGKRESIQMTLVGERILLTVIFDEQTTLGMVRLYAKEAAKRLATELYNNDSSDRPEVDLGDDFSATAKEQLEKIFK